MISRATKLTIANCQVITRGGRARAPGLAHDMAHSSLCERAVDQPLVLLQIRLRRQIRRMLRIHPPVSANTSTIHGCVKKMIMPTINSATTTQIMMKLRRTCVRVALPSHQGCSSERGFSFDGSLLIRSPRRRGRGGSAAR